MLVLGSQKELPIRLSSLPPPILDRSSPAASSSFDREILDKPRQSGRVKKTTEKIVSAPSRSQRKRDEEKEPKIRKFRFQKGPQLMDFLSKLKAASVIERGAGLGLDR